jgi:hypothetical protein
LQFSGWNCRYLKCTTMLCFKTIRVPYC